MTINRLFYQLINILYTLSFFGLYVNVEYICQETGNFWFVCQSTFRDYDIKQYARIIKMLPAVSNPL